MCFSILLNLLNVVTVSVPYDLYMGNGAVSYAVSQIPLYSKKVWQGSDFFQKSCDYPLGHAQIMRESPIWLLEMLHYHNMSSVLHGQASGTCFGLWTWKMPSHSFSEVCNLSDGKYLKSVGRTRDSSSRRLAGRDLHGKCKGVQISVFKGKKFLSFPRWFSYHEETKVPCLPKLPPH